MTACGRPDRHFRDAMSRHRRPLPYSWTFWAVVSWSTNLSTENGWNIGPTFSSALEVKAANSSVCIHPQ